MKGKKMRERERERERCRSSYFPLRGCEKKLRKITTQVWAYRARAHKPFLTLAIPVVLRSGAATPRIF